VEELKRTPRSSAM